MTKTSKDARDYLVSLMGARLADQLLAQLYAAGFKIVPFPRGVTHDDA